MHRAADPDQRPLGLGQHVRQPVEILRARAGKRRRARQRGRDVGLGVEHILGHHHRDRARGAALGDMEGARHRLRRLVRVVDLDDELGHVGEQPAVVLLLQRHAPGLPALDLADQHHHRGRVVPSGMEADHRVRESRTARHHQHAGLAAAHPPVGGGHERRAALVAADDQPHAVVVGHRVGEAEIALARHAIDDVDVVRLEAIDDGAADRMGHGVLRVARFQPL